MNKVSLTVFASMAGILALGACSKDSLPVYSHLDSLRVLALIANTPEVTPGASLIITPYISDPLGAGRALKFSARGCPDPGVAAGARPTCLGQATTVTIADQQAVTLPVASNSYTGSVNTFSVAIPAAALVGQSSMASYNGVSYLVTYDLVSSDGASVSSFKRIVVSSGAKPANQNPSVTDILSAGGSLNAASLAPSTVVPMAAVIPASSAETYTYQDSGGSVISATESLLVTWFSNTGDFKYIRTNFLGDANTFTPGSAPVGGHPTFVVVVRDGRGGEAIFQKNF